MEVFYLEIRTVHIGSVAVSGGFFLMRALAFNLFEAEWPRAAPVRWLSYTIDTVLLTSALMLMTIVSQYPFAHHWLTVKIVLLIVYILLGVQALRPYRNRRARLGFTVAAAFVFLFIVTVARAHHPLGLFSAMTG